MTQTLIVLDSRQELPADVAQLVSAHDLRDQGVVHTDLDVLSCACRAVARRPNSTGDVCTDCGGMMVRTGSCTTCVECASTGGCG